VHFKAFALSTKLTYPSIDRVSESVNTTQYIISTAHWQARYGGLKLILILCFLKNFLNSTQNLTDYFLCQSPIYLRKFHENKGTTY